jgi:hypothetical protein
MRRQTYSENSSAGGNLPPFIIRRFKIRNTKLIIFIANSRGTSVAVARLDGGDEEDQAMLEALASSLEAACFLLGSILRVC